MGLVVLTLLLAGGWAFLQSNPTPTAPRAIAWSLQPDSLPLAAARVGSTFEISLGIFSDEKSAPLPQWTTRLPKWAKDRVESWINLRRTLAVRRQWRCTVEAPEFLKVRRQEWMNHSFHGAFASLWLTAVATRPGTNDGIIKVTLTATGYETHTLEIPVHWRVVDSAPQGSVLVTSTPFDRFATQDGRDFEPLGKVSTWLAERGVRVDYLEALPKRLDDWQVLLLGTDTLVNLNEAGQRRVQEFVRRGGRLVLSADAFYDTTTAQANRVLQPFGLRLGSRDAGMGMTADRLIQDPFTAGVSSLEFWRPTCISVTDPAQARLLATTADNPHCGFLAVSREKDRGEIVVLAQSLWSLWIKPESGTNQAWVLQHLLLPPHRSGSVK